MKFYGIDSETITDTEPHQFSHPGSGDENSVYIISGTLINNSGSNETVNIISPFYRAGFSKIELDSGERVKLKDIPAFSIALMTKGGSLQTDLTIYAVTPSSDEDSNPSLPESVHPMVQRDYGEASVSGTPSQVYTELFSVAASTTSEITAFASNYPNIKDWVLNGGNAVLFAYSPSNTSTTPSNMSTYPTVSVVEQETTPAHMFVYNGSSASVNILVEIWT